MHCKSSPPSNLLQVLSEDLHWCIASDLDLSGHFGQSFLLLGHSSVLSGDTQKVQQHLRLAEISAFLLEELPGSIRIIARHDSGDRILITASPELAQEFGGVCRALEAIRQGQTPLLPEVLPIRDPLTGDPLRQRGLFRSRRRGVSTLMRLLGLLHDHRRRLTLLMLLTFASVGAQLIPPLIFRSITDDVIGAHRLDLLPMLIGAMVVLFVVISVTRFFANRQNQFLSITVVSHLRSKLHRKLQRLEMGYHHQHESGELIGRISHDTDQLQQFLVEGLPWFLVNIVSFTTIGITLFVLDPYLAMAVLIPVPVFIVGSAIFHAGMVRWWHRSGNRVARMYSVLGESIRGIRAVKATVQEERRSKQFDGINQQMVAATLGRQRTWTMFMETTTLAMAAGTIVVWTLGASKIGHGGQSGGTSLGTLIAFIGYMAMFYGPLQWFSFVTNWFAQAMTGAERIFQLLDQPEEGGPENQGNPFKANPGTGVKVEFESVHFSYERGRAVLRGVNITIAPGTMVGLVGRSGAGKSTIINLLSRFYNPDAGRILIDGQDLTGLRLGDWRRSVGLVPQEPFLFNTSIAANILAARPEATFAEVVAASKAAHAHEFIMKKMDGYDTLVGEGGITLSGGEKQRIAIARAILQDPPLLILDEATSAVDSETEAKIQEAIERLVRGRTTIAIAHRLATLRRAQRLIVIDDGRIAEEGTHAELLAKPDGLFAKLAKTQQELIQVMSLSGDLAPLVTEHDDQGTTRSEHPNLVQHGDRLAWMVDGKPRPVQLAWYRPLSGRGQDLAVIDEKGHELARIPAPENLTGGTADLVKTEVDLRYDDPTIERIHSVRFDQGNRFMDLSTNRGRRRILIRAIEKNFTWQSDGSAIITDMTGNRFRLPAKENLDTASRRRLEEIL